MALQGTQQDLVDAIVGVLSSKQGMEYCSTAMDVPDADGNISEVKTALAGQPGGIDFATAPNLLTTGTGVRGSATNGAEALATIIAEKTLNHIIENFELAAQARLDTLENDFNLFLTTLQIVAPTLTVNMFGAGAAQTAALTAAVMAGGGPARAAKTAALKAKELAMSFGTGNL